MKEGNAFTLVDGVAVATCDPYLRDHWVARIASFLACEDIAKCLDVAARTGVRYDCVRQNASLCAFANAVQASMRAQQTAFNFGSRGGALVRG